MTVDHDLTAEPATQTAGSVTVLAGATFAVSGRTGDMHEDAAQGMFFQDTRLVSRWRLRVDGRAPQVLAVEQREPFEALFVGRVLPTSGSTELLVERRRYIGEGMREDLRLRNLGADDLTATVTVEVAADFADLFDVKEGMGSAGAAPHVEVEESALLMRVQSALRGVRVQLAGAAAAPGRLEMQVEVPARGEWAGQVLVRPLVDGGVAADVFPVGVPLEQSPPAVRMRAWRAGSPRVRTSHRGLARTLQRSLEDLGALRIHGEDDVAREVAVAAGAPWFMALFGRDSLLTSYLALPLDPSLALGTLKALARRQGTRLVPETEEQPGRILHETRLGARFPLSHGAGDSYYGSADATPLFVVVLGELRRWGIAVDEVLGLLPHADRALAWVEEFGDRDGDGFVEYARSTPSGLLHQGWKDSHDGVSFADGTLAEPPIALCEVQGYVYAAYLARAHFAAEAGDHADRRHWTDRADRLKRAFNERFWLPDRGWFALALDRDKRPVDALASNMGHCLWSGIVDDDKAAQVAERLVSPEMFSGWGVRTLATAMGAYNPLGYHNGSVWPHDNALIATGLMRYGFVEQAQQVALALLDAAAAFDGRLPELFSGFDRAEYAAPLPFPTSCSPQAWAAATPVQLLRLLLRVDPSMPRGRLWVAPQWPERLGPIEVHDLPLAGGRVTLSVDGDRASVDGLPDDVELVREPRPVARHEF